MRIRTIGISLFLMLVALFIYVFYRPEETVACQLWAALPFSVWVDLKNLRQTLPLNTFLVYSFPAGLWVFSTTILSFKQSLTILNHKLSLVYLPILYGVGLEFMQSWGLTDGTFDYFDLGAMLIAWAGAVAYLSFQNKRGQEGSKISKLVVVCYAVLILADTF